MQHGVDLVHQAPDVDPWSTLVYATRGTDIRMTMVDGRVLVEDVSGQTMGQAFTGHGMHGYDNVTGLDAQFGIFHE